MGYTLFCPLLFNSPLQLGLCRHDLTETVLSVVTTCERLKLCVVLEALVHSLLLEFSPLRLPDVVIS